MRFMMIVIPKGYETAAPDAVPDAATVSKMMEYNKSLQKAGVLLALDGLLPPSTGARVSYSDGKATVTDGPFAEAKEVIGGYWIIQVRSREEAIEWARRAPMSRPWPPRRRNCIVRSMKSAAKWRNRPASPDRPSSKPTAPTARSKVWRRPRNASEKW